MAKEPYRMLNEGGIPFFVYPRKDAHEVCYYRFLNHHKSTKTAKRKEAIEVAREAIREYLLQRATEGAESLFLGKVVSGYLKGRRTVLAPSTACVVERFLGWFLKGREEVGLAQITKDEFHGFLNDLYHQLNPAKSYWRDILSRYNQFFNWCIETKKMTENPTKGYPRPKADQYKVCEVVWEESEFSAVWKAVNAEDRTILEVLRFTGIYPKDIYWLAKKHFAWDGDVLKLVKRREKAKSTKEVYKQPLDSRVEDLLRAKWEEARFPDHRFFGTGSEEAYKNWYNLFQKRVANAWRRAIRNSLPKELKALRHAYATEHIERGVPEDVLLEWMGHSPGSTVLRRHYLHRKSTARYRYVSDSSGPPTPLLHHEP